MTLDEMTKAQLHRLYRRLYNRLPRDGACYGWDWRTLRSAYPGLARAMSRVLAAIRRKTETDGGEHA